MWRLYKFQSHKNGYGCVQLGDSTLKKNAYESDIGEVSRLHSHACGVSARHFAISGKCSLHNHI